MNDLPKLKQTLPAGALKVTLYNHKTKETLERWPIDAREMLARSEDWSLVPPEPVKNPEPVKDPVPHVKAAEALAKAEHSPGVPLNVTTGGEPPKKSPPARRSRKNTPKDGEKK